MNERRVLIVGSALAAFSVATLAFVIVTDLNFEFSADGDLWFWFLVLIMPAVFTAVISAWWHTRDPVFVQYPSGSLAVRILVAAYFLTSACFTVILPIAWLVEYSGHYRDVLQLLRGILLAMVGGAVFGFLLMLLTMLPALLVQYAVVRLARSRWIRGSSFGVLS